MDPQIALYLQHAVEHFQQGRWHQAESLLAQVLARDPHNFSGLHVMGIVHVVQRRHDDAIDFLRRAVNVAPDHALVNYNMAIALSGAGRDEEALAYHASAVALSPDNQDAWVNYGKSLASLGRHAEALDCYDRALSLDPAHAAALSNRAVALAELDRNEEALAIFEQVLQVDPRYPAAWLNAANTLCRLDRHTQALDYYERALGLDPYNPDILSNKANALSKMRRHEEALSHYDRALQLAPHDPDLWFNKAYILTRMEQHDQALAHYARVVALAPNHMDAWYMMGNLQNQVKRFEEAAASFDRAMAIDPTRDYLMGDRLSAKMSLCDWQDLPAQQAALAAAIEAGKRVATPFTALTLFDSPSLQRKVAQDYAKNFASDRPMRVSPPRPVGEKVRIAYFTKDFHEHATAFLTAELFELHDRNRFEVIAISYGPPRADPMRRRLEQAFDQFIDVRERSDADIAQLCRDMAIDMAVDLQGYQTQHRPGIFAQRAAPIQVNYLAYPGTMGAPFMDYLIADPVLVPAAHREYYAEKIVYLPHSYQPNDRQQVVPATRRTRQDWGLPTTGTVFCCFNNHYKITPAVFDRWLRILQQVDSSVLWLLEDNPVASRHLRLAAERAGVASERLIFAPVVSHVDHLARHGLADLFLDTLPYNAHTTASDALRMGLPLLTCLGESFTGRVAASLLHAVGLPELVAPSPEAYEHLAVTLGTQTEKLAAVKQKLSANVKTMPLFDTPRYTKYLETAYLTMVARYRNHLPVDHIVIPE